MCAANKGHVMVVKYLVQAGASKDRMSKVRVVHCHSYNACLVSCSMWLSL
jgi:hypothetical protein